MHKDFSRRLKTPAGALALHDWSSACDLSQLRTDISDCRSMLKAHSICMMHQRS